MQATFARNSLFPCGPRPRALPAGLLRALPLLIASNLPLPIARAQPQHTVLPPLGIVWQVQGIWIPAGGNAPLHAGEALPAGVLLQPGQETGGHAIHIFLPDGQRIFYECFTASDCARGFRVPPLYRRPDPFAVDMLARIRAALAGDMGADAGNKQKSLPRDELVAALGSDRRVQLAGLAADLPNGQYTYDLRPLRSTRPAEFHRPLEKTTGSIAVPLPGTGLYDLRITDSRNAPRIDLFIAAVDTASSARIAGDFKRASTLLGDWNIDYQGWPIHEFQWAFLESMVLNLRPQPAVPATLKLVAVSTHRSAGTAEPMFSPRPGVFKGDMEVTLHCATPGATIRFTVDNSQPLAGSPVYSAPIMVKGTELTVKAYATAPGKKDSSVVTGIFRINQNQ